MAVSILITIGIMKHCVKRSCSGLWKALLLSGLGVVSVSQLSSAAPINVGDAYAGGKVVYILQPGDPGYKPDEQHGLIAANDDVSVEPTNWSAAKTMTETLEISGTKGWTVPSREELNKVYQNRAAVGNLKDYSYYWSSTESGAKVWAQDFYNGEQVQSPKAGAASGIRRVRPVKKF